VDDVRYAALNVLLNLENIFSCGSADRTAPGKISWKVFRYPSPCDLVSTQPLCAIALCVFVSTFVCCR